MLSKMFIYEKKTKYFTVLRSKTKTEYSRFACFNSPKISVVECLI